MKELKQFQCEYCNTVYKSKSECESCEKGHIRLLSIKSAKYHAVKNDGEFPHRIEIETNDGRIVQYDFSGCLK